ncbi:MAG: phospho-N-acetylmuramoyl-pentapeptide-transferase [Campylobacterota bacterium]|nr:phospho-N-acetylmuramoyl-pentapeptide-transferase [Campylobacterota bacterium]
MLYALYQLLDINLFSYITVRAGIGFMIAFGLTLYLFPRYIAWAIAKNANQPINKYVPAHDGKQHTPTMGGAIFLFSTVLAILLTANLANIYILAGLVTIIGFGLVGLKDDLGKVLSGDNLEGLTPRNKLLLQLLVGSIVVGILFYANFPTTLHIPFLKTHLIDMGYFAIPFWLLLFLAVTNAVNLTDGLDGLATIPSVIALGTLGLIVYVTGHAIMADYLLIPNIKGVGEVTILAASFAGALLGFLWYNCHPAELFMGDTGSLSIGGAIGYLAILGKSEILLLLIGFIFVIETLSVILQVASFKLRGKRIFLMAPIHHHFELKHWAENKIIVRFWMIALISNVMALVSFKFR